eukprot:m.205737 g.205737  ORF g.205737 m.205737 type:complete len:212 (+) comp18880_c0_seq34:1309-1944(+)
MAEYVRQAKARLLHRTPNFLELDSICAPPIDFADALMKAKTSLEVELLHLTRDGVGPAEHLTAVKQNASITFAYLSMQLHARGSQEFWGSLDCKATASYLTFRLVDLYADILTHIDDNSYKPAASLEWLCSDVALSAFAWQFSFFATCIKAQRENAGIDWYPDEAAVAEIMAQYKAKQDRFATSSLLIKYAIIAAAAVAVVAVLVRLHRRH